MLSSVENLVYQWIERTCDPEFLSFRFKSHLFPGESRESEIPHRALNLVKRKQLKERSLKQTPSLAITTEADRDLHQLP